MTVGHTDERTDGQTNYLFQKKRRRPEIYQIGNNNHPNVLNFVANIVFI